MDTYYISRNVVVINMNNIIRPDHCQIIGRLIIVIFQMISTISPSSQNFSILKTEE